MEDFKRVEFFPDAYKLHRLIDDASDGKRRSAPRIAVKLRQDHSVKAEAVMEGSCRVDGILTRHRVDNKEYLVRFDGLFDRLDLAHHLLIDVQASCGVENDDIAGSPSRLVEAMRRDLDRSTASLRKHGYLDLRPQHLELVNGRGSVNIGGSKQGEMPLLLEMIGELRAKRRLPRSLESRDHHDRRRHRGKPDFRARRPHQFHQLVVDDLDDELARSDALENLLSDGARPDVVDELLDDLVVDVGIEENAANLTERFGDIGFADLPLSAKLPEDEL